MSGSPGGTGSVAAGDGCRLSGSRVSAAPEADAVVKGITANYAVFSRETVCAITFLANFQFFSFAQT